VRPDPKAPGAADAPSGNPRRVGAAYRDGMTGSPSAHSTTTPRSPSGAALQRDRSARLAAADRRISFVSRILDDLVEIPGTSRRIGVEPVIGLIPGVGDLVSAVVGVWLIIEATRFRLPAVVVTRMVLNTLVDLVVGVVPVLGDLFDFAFKSNTRNAALFRRYAADPTASTREHKAVLLGAVVALIGIGWLVVALIGWLFGTVVGP